MPTPSCGCIAAYTKEDKLTAIYCVIYGAITTPVNLPSCACVSNYTELAKLDAIYCALLQFTQQPYSGQIEPSQINGITPFGQDVLTASPGADRVIGTNVAGAFTTFSISAVGQGFLGMDESAINAVPFVSGTTVDFAELSDVGRNLLAIPTPIEDDSFIALDSAGGVVVRTSAQTAEFLLVDVSGGIASNGTQTPVSSITYGVGGVIIAIS